MKTFNENIAIIREYKRRISRQVQFGDQARRPGHGQGRVKEKYWFAPDGRIFPVEREHGDQALKIARELELIRPDKAIAYYGYRNNWQLAVGHLLKRGWLRVQVFESKTVGMNALPKALTKKSTEQAAFTILPKAKGFSFQENWPYTLEYATPIREYKEYGWRDMIKRARRLAERKKNVELAEVRRFARRK